MVFQAVIIHAQGLVFWRFGPGQKLQPRRWVNCLMAIRLRFLAGAENGIKLPQPQMRTMKAGLVRAICTTIAGIDLWRDLQKSVLQFYKHKSLSL